MRAAFVLFVLSHAWLLAPSLTHAQAPDTLDRDAVSKAQALVADSLFARLQAGEAEAVATWVTDELDASAMGRSRRQRISQYRSQFTVVTQEGPRTRFGAMTGYFRLTYITYHEQAPLVWVLHFYIRPGGEPTLNYFEFAGENPFEQVLGADTAIDGP